MKTSLIVGMGIGSLYEKVLGELGHGIITVDSNPDKKADFLTVEDAIEKCHLFDTVHICTPNFTHAKIAQQLAPYCDIVFIEKPGVANSQIWSTLWHSHNNVRFMMVKNNMWRDNLDEMRSHVADSRTVKIKWINKNRIPSPGTWFTTKEFAYGGVSRDLMPHLLSIYISLNPTWRTANMTGQESRQIWTLDKIEDSEYGQVKRDGTYDVDDLAKIKYMQNGRVWKMTANWADGKADDRCVEFEKADGSVVRFELGLCPESAYKSMIQDALDNKDNFEFWKQQFEYDTWIHERIENL